MYIIFRFYCNIFYSKYKYMCVCVKWPPLSPPFSSFCYNIFLNIAFFLQFPKFQVPWQQQPVPRHHLAESQLIRIWQQVQQKTDSIYKKNLTHLSILITSYVCTIQNIIVPSHSTLSLACRGWKKNFLAMSAFILQHFL